MTGLSEEEAGRKPTEMEWSVKEVLAHLIHSERGLQDGLAELVSGAEASYDGFEGNLDARNQATLAAFPTLPDLLSELKRLYVETLALIACLPPNFANRKASYWRLGFQVLQINPHFQIHLEQMQAAIQTLNK